MRPTTKEIVQLYFEKIKSNEMDFSNVRAELVKQDYNNEEINVILKRIDRHLRQDVVIKSENDKGKYMVITGLCFIVLGILITVLTYTRVFDLGKFYIIAYGPVVFGFLLASIGKLKMNR